ncbi:MAG: Secretion system C-terminal sorting domain [Bacteroidota bacterium]
MNLRVILLVLLCPFSVTISSAQELISADGNFSVNTQGSLSWSVGEIITETQIASGNQLTQGFQQNYEDFLNVEQLLQYSEILLYPNPFSTSVTVQNSSQFEDIHLTIFDTQQKIILEHTIEFSLICQKTTFDLSYLPAGMYFFKFQQVDSQATIIDYLLKI